MSPRLPHSGVVAAAATTYYVSPKGNDSWTGTQQRPWRTIQKAATAAPAGSTISVASGAYAFDSVAIH